MALCIQEATRVHVDSMNAYLSAKNHLFISEIYKIWIRERNDAMKEVMMVRFTEASKRRLQAMNVKIFKKKKESAKL